MYTNAIQQAGKTWKETLKKLEGDWGRGLVFYLFPTYIHNQIFHQISRQILTSSIPIDEGPRGRCQIPIWRWLRDGKSNSWICSLNLPVIAIRMWMARRVPELESFVSCVNILFHRFHHGHITIRILLHNFTCEFSSNMSRRNKIMCIIQLHV